MPLYASSSFITTLCLTKFMQDIAFSSLEAIGGRDYPTLAACSCVIGGSRHPREFYCIYKYAAELWLCAP
jgi:hypothetical protein